MHKNAILFPSPHFLPALSPPSSCPSSSSSQVMQQAGVDGIQTLFLLKDYQLVDPTFLELVNSLLSSGEVPGLYTLEELEPMLAPLRDSMSQEGFRGTLAAYFSTRVKANLHIVLVMDSSSTNFMVHCESTPALYTHCSFQSMEGWSKQSMLRIPQMFLQNTVGTKLLRRKELQGSERPVTGGEELVKAFLHIHNSCLSTGATPRKYMTFLRTYQSVYASRK